MFRLRQAPITRFVLVLLTCAFLTACRSVALRPTEAPVAVATSISPPTAAATSAPWVVAPTDMPAPATAEPTPAAVAPTPAMTLSPPSLLPTGGDEPEHGRYKTPEPPLPTRTPRPPPTPTPMPLTACAEGEWRFYFEAGGGLPLDVTMSDPRFAFDRPRSFYVAVANWVGLIRMEQPFDLAARYDIDVPRFVEMPDFPLIADLEVQNDVAFVVGGSQLAVVNATWNCYWRPITEATFPFPAQDVELEGERIYVGGSDGQQLHIAVLDRAALPDVRQLATLTFPPGLWSVAGDQLLTYESPSAAVTITDVSDLSAPVSRLVQLPLDPEWDAIGPPHLVDDAFSLLIRDRGLLSVSGLLEAEQEVHWHAVQDDFMLGGHLAQERYLLIVGNFLDSYDASSAIHVAIRDSQEGFVTAGLYPHFPVYSGYAIQDDIVFAFSDYLLIVIDLTEPTVEKIVRTYPLRGRLDQ